MAFLSRVEVWKRGKLTVTCLASQKGIAAWRIADIPSSYFCSLVVISVHRPSPSYKLMKTLGALITVFTDEITSVRTTNLCRKIDDVAFRRNGRRRFRVQRSAFYFLIGTRYISIFLHLDVRAATDEAWWP